ncbi:MAG: type II secretion system minor pseudopilin GspH [Gammaproteobacteria bacterium]
MNGTGNRRPQRLTGMTLIEVLVVIAIMAIVLGLASFSFQNSGQRQARISAEKLTAQINHAALLATLSGSSMGLAFARDQYRFMQHEPPPAELPWVPATQRGLYRVTLPTRIDRLALMLDSSAVALSADLPTTPQLVFAANGQLPDFEILLRDDAGESEYLVTVAPDRFRALLAPHFSDH